MCSQHQTNLRPPIFHFFDFLIHFHIRSLYTQFGSAPLSLPSHASL
jgi:hypothetical protein